MKVLISEGFGAGWATWNDKSKQVAEYAPIIEYLENGGDRNLLDDDHPLILQMIEELELSPNSFYTGGRDGLVVVETGDQYAINEYDGYESLITPGSFWQ